MASPTTEFNTLRQLQNANSALITLGFFGSHASSGAVNTIVQAVDACLGEDTRRNPDDLNGSYRQGSMALHSPDMGRNRAVVVALQVVAVNAARALAAQGDDYDADTRGMIASRFNLGHGVQSYLQGPDALSNILGRFPKSGLTQADITEVLTHRPAPAPVAA